MSPSWNQEIRPLDPDAPTDPMDRSPLCCRSGCWGRTEYTLHWDQGPKEGEEGTHYHAHVCGEHAESYARRNELCLPGESKPPAPRPRYYGSPWIGGGGGEHLPKPPKPPLPRISVPVRT